MLKLLPDNTLRPEGAPEKIDYALYEALASRVLDLHAAINDGTENCVMARINRRVANGEILEPQQIKDMIREIDNEISAIHAQICLAARYSKRG